MTLAEELGEVYERGLDTWQPIVAAKNETGFHIVSGHRRHMAQLLAFALQDWAQDHSETAVAIFRMFQALHPERETAGVGLSIVKKIVEAHGGAIHVEPTPGGGATFRFSVPKQLRDRSREHS